MQSTEMQPRPLSRAFFYQWLVWYLLSLPFVLSKCVSVLPSARSSGLLFNIHDTLGYLNFVSGLLTLSQPVFGILLWSRAQATTGPALRSILVMWVLSCVGCVALFLALIGI